MKKNRVRFNAKRSKTEIRGVLRVEFAWTQLDCIPHADDNNFNARPFAASGKVDADSGNPEP